MSNEIQAGSNEIQGGEAGVYAAQQQFWTARLKKDPALFMEVLEPDFVARSPWVPDLTRDAFIRALTDIQSGISTISAQDMAIHIFGDVAVLTGVQVAEICLPGGGSAVVSRVILTNVFRVSAGRWRMVLSYSYETKY